MRTLGLLIFNLYNTVDCAGSANLWLVAYDSVIFIHDNDPHRIYSDIVYVGGLTHIQTIGNWSLLIHDTKWAAILCAIHELIQILIIDPQGGGT